MRRNAPLAVPVVITALVGILTACATADDGVLVQEQDPTAEPPAKVPTPDAGGSTSSSTGGTDAGTSSSSGGSTSSTSSSSSGGNDGGASSGSTTSSSGGTSAVCDTSNLVKLVLWQAEVVQQTVPVPCPCSAGKCCYLGVTCLTDL